MLLSASTLKYFLQKKYFFSQLPSWGGGRGEREILAPRERKEIQFAKKKKRGRNFSYIKERRRETRGWRCIAVKTRQKEPSTVQFSHKKKLSIDMPKMTDFPMFFLLNVRHGYFFLFSFLSYVQKHLTCVHPEIQSFAKRKIPQQQRNTLKVPRLIQY